VPCLTLALFFVLSKCVDADLVSKLAFNQPTSSRCTWFFNRSSFEAAVIERNLRLREFKTTVENVKAANPMHYIGAFDGVTSSRNASTLVKEYPMSFTVNTANTLAPFNFFLSLLAKGLKQKDMLLSSNQTYSDFAKGDRYDFIDTIQMGIPGHEDDSFMLSFKDGNNRLWVHAVGMNIHDNTETQNEYIEVSTSVPKVNGVADAPRQSALNLQAPSPPPCTLSDIPAGVHVFIGVLSLYPINDLKFIEDSGPDDIELGAFIFGLDENDVISSARSWAWGIFFVLFSVCIIIDYTFGNTTRFSKRRSHECDDSNSRGTSTSADGQRVLYRAVILTTAWLVVAVLYSLVVYKLQGFESCLQFLSGFVVEECLSVDNVFVFLMLFERMKTPTHLQPSILNGGVLLALILRAIMVVVGSMVFGAAMWLMPLIGLFLLYSALKMLVEDQPSINDGTDSQSVDANGDIVNTYAINCLRRSCRISPDYDPHGRLFIRVEGEIHATPQLLVLLLLGISDVIFALDSIPAILSITTDPLLVISSNAFAVMGLRSLFFVLAGLAKLFRYLQQALAVLLAGVGLKMILAWWHFHIPIHHMFLFILFVIIAAILASMYTSSAKMQVDVSANHEIPVIAQAEQDRPRLHSAVPINAHTAGIQKQRKRCEHLV